MLVAVALVVLMMTLFVVIFQMATSTMATQKGLAENDQRVRLVSTMLRADFKNRTFRLVLPFSNGEDPTATVGRRDGYLYIAENDPGDDTDDVLQFTVDVPTGGDLYFGAAKLLLADGTGAYGPPGTPTPPAPPPLPQGPQNAPNGAYWPDQPEFDDGLAGTPNQSASAPNAEVSYFLRNGTLYRRVLLIREPRTTAPLDAQPKDAIGNPLDLTPFEGAGPLNFWSYFDYSAWLGLNGVEFNWTGSLLNTPGPLNGILGKPNFRFGFDVLTGLPREYAQNWLDETGTPGIGQRFIGRFTHWETSAQAFGYPGRAAPDPHAAATVLTLDARDGVINEYSLSGAQGHIPSLRAAEDVVMTNVVRFDVKVWDDAAAFGPDGQPGLAVDQAAGPGLADDDQNGITNRDGSGNVDLTEMGWPGSDDGAFVDLGHGGAYGFYSAARLNTTQAPEYCPPHVTNPATRHFRFDTWHPQADLNRDGTDDDQPPFRGAMAGPDGMLGTPDDVPRPLKAIQLTIVFFDPASQQLRDFTLVQSLTP